MGATTPIPNEPLWVTLNRKLAGTHTFQITGATAAYRLYLPLAAR